VSWEFLQRASATRRCSFRAHVWCGDVGSAASAASPESAGEPTESLFWRLKSAFGFGQLAAAAWQRGNGNGSAGELCHRVTRCTPVSFRLSAANSAVITASPAAYIDTVSGDFCNRAVIAQQRSASVRSTVTFLWSSSGMEIIRTGKWGLFWKKLTSP